MKKKGLTPLIITITDIVANTEVNLAVPKVTATKMARAIVPEPPTIVLIGLVLAGMDVMRRVCQRQKGKMGSERN